MYTLSRNSPQLAGLNSDWGISHFQLDVQSHTLTLSLEFLVLLATSWQHVELTGVFKMQRSVLLESDL